ncbi:MAG: fibronectin type III domain-containing protein, partial [Candidatus Zixiibacteriota bacterium]
MLRRIIRRILRFFFLFAVISVCLPAQPVDAALTSSEATSQSVTLSWTAVGDDGTTGVASTYDVRYSGSMINEGNWSSALQAQGEPSPQPAGSAETFTVTGLSPATTYYFAVKVSDEAGNWSALSNVVQRTTEQETDPPSVVADLSPSNVTSTSLALNWTAPGDDADTGTASEYDLRYSTSVINATNFDLATRLSGLPNPQPAGASESFTVTGLDPSTEYYFAIKTADEVPNWSGISNVVNVTTGAEQNAPDVIADLATSNPTPTSITLSWTAPGDDGSSGTASEYDIRYSTSLITGANFASATQVSGEPSPQSAGSSESFVVTGLTSSTTYYFAIKTADEVPNWSGISNVVTGATGVEVTPPAFVSNLNAGNETETTVTLTWTATGDDGNVGTASQYDIRYSTSSITEQNWDSAVEVTGEPTPGVAGTPESFVITGLGSDTVYYFAIKVADEVPNWSELSNVASRRTSPDQTPPAAIDDLTAATGSDEGQILLGWTAPGDDDLAGTVAGYQIRTSPTMITASSWESAILYDSFPDPVAAGELQGAVLAGLEPGQFYYVAVKSYDENMNLSPLSSMASAIAGFNWGTGTEDQIAAQLSPPPGAEVPSAHPVLVAENVSPDTVDIYLFEVAADSGFAFLAAAGSVSEEQGTTTRWKTNQPLLPE